MKVFPVSSFHTNHTRYENRPYDLRDSDGNSFLVSVQYDKAKKFVVGRITPVECKPDDPRIYTFIVFDDRPNKQAASFNLSPMPRYNLNKLNDALNAWLPRLSKTVEIWQKEGREKAVDFFKNGE